MSGVHFDADAAGRGVKAWKDRVAGGLLHQGYHGRSSKTSRSPLPITAATLVVSTIASARP